MQHDNEDLYQLSEQQLNALAALETTAAARLRRDILDSFTAIKDRIDANWQEIQSRGALALQLELTKLDQLRATLEILDPTRAAQIRATFEGIFKEGSAAGDTLAQELMRARSSSTVRTFGALPLVAIANIAGQSMERLRSHTETFRSKATSLMILGLSQGWGPEKIKQELRNQLNIVAHRAETIQRTETLSALNEAAAQRYRAEQVSLVQWMPTGDDRTCPVCADRAGEIYRLSEAPAPPIHPRCRCVLVPADNLSQADREWSRSFAAEVKALAGKTDPGPAAFETSRPIPFERF